MPHEIHALLGTNGTGKSTLARLIMGCGGYTLASGQIRFAGTAINDLKIHQRARLGITLAWQEPARFEGITVRDYLSLGEPDVDPTFYLDQVGLDSDAYLGRMVDKTLSGGERKRIELAAVLARRPKLAILDEPAAGIDVLSIQGRYQADFSLTTGRVGRLSIDTLVEAAAQAVTDLTTRVFAHDTDEIRLQERVVLAGEASRGLIKTRMVLEGQASAEVTSITEGNAAGARGHMVWTAWRW